MIEKEAGRAFGHRSRVREEGDPEGKKCLFSRPAGEGIGTTGTQGKEEGGGFQRLDWDDEHKQLGKKRY